ncbi:MAG: hypothetical protein R6U96_12520 [Promethearchaeia archaeon]
MRSQGVFKRNFYLIDAKGLAKILQALKNNNIIEPNHAGNPIISIDKLFQLFGIDQPKRQKKFLHLLLENIQKFRNYALIVPDSKEVNSEVKRIVNKSSGDMINESLPELNKILDSPKSYFLIFYSKFKHPENKRLIYKLLITALIGIGFLSIFLPLLLLINK